MLTYQTPLRVGVCQLALTPEKELEQVSRNDPSDIVNEGPTKKKGGFELTETFTECYWDLDPVLAEYNKK